MPDELDPQVREFASQLRRLVDRSGLSIASVADRTGYSKTSWERYLNGRLLAPKGAIVALAEVTGTNPVHLTTMWELAERAWSKSEMRHDMTMEAIRISQARAALGEFGPPPATSAGGKGGKAVARSGSATVTPGIAGPAGVAPTVPPQPVASEAPDGGGAGASEAASSQGSSGANSWRLAGYQGPSPAGGRSPVLGAPERGSASDGVVRTPETPSGYGEAPGPGGGSSSGAGRRRLTMFLAGLVGVLVVMAAVFFLTDRGSGGKHGRAKASPSPSVSSVDLPAGVKCAGASCTGKDAEAMGCTKDAAAVTTAKTATVGTVTLEVRYSKTCGAAWGRITAAAPGDSVQVTAGTAKENDSITQAGDTIAYTPMVAVKDAGEAKACATLASGQKGCTP
ncbi:DUF2690 domain-containing protein [Streptomyces griseorubiginosus]|uniref:DUF2690 domain-containing protein n=1 Tax=Streptomyces griseorubiginosus TaxID=67304 RepID=UPI001FCA6A19|nr:DUF2690 domain-containing protein [Streptomyces griseorubiginosus]